MICETSKQWLLLQLRMFIKCAEFKALQNEKYIYCTAQRESQELCMKMRLFMTIIKDNLIIGP